MSCLNDKILEQVLGIDWFEDSGGGCYSEQKYNFWFAYHFHQGLFHYQGVYIRKLILYLQLNHQTNKLEIEDPAFSPQSLDFDLLLM